MKKLMPFLGIENKAGEVYSKFSFEDFWNYISPDNRFIYELRIKTKKSDSKDSKEYIKEIGKFFHIPYHYSGVFVKNVSELRKVCVFCYQKELTLYISSNPKRKSLYSGNARYPTYNGKMQSDEAIVSLLIDFDANEELKNNKEIDSAEEAYKVARKFLEDNKNIKNYLMLCSGNGVQIRIKLDGPIYLPAPTYDQNNEFIITDEFDAYRYILKEAMREILPKYSTGNIFVDMSSLELARVGRCPFSRNWKNENNPKFSGIIEIKDEEENSGLSQHILSFFEKTKEKRSQAKKYENNRTLAKEFTHSASTIRFSPLAVALLKDRLPEGGRNNRLIYQFKLLVKNNNLDFNNVEIRELFRDMERIQGDIFPTNDPGAGLFSPDSVNIYFIEHGIEYYKKFKIVLYKPIYSVLYYIKKEKRNIDVTKFYTELLKYYESIPAKYWSEKLSDGYNMVHRIKNFIKEEDIFNPQKYIEKDRKILKLFRAIVNSYDLETLQYLIESGILKEILNKI